ncbi:MAG TPA: sialidase family protein, partial [Anaerolineae bacterium]|nr:sialidase family protein [Anaerolineae bacterium]
NQNEVTRAQVAARPWLRVDPQGGDLFLTYVAQYRDTLATPSLNRSSDGGANWSFTARVDQSISIADIQSGHIAPPGDIQVLLGEDNQVALVWIWRGDTEGWPRDLWLALSSDGGENFSAPRRIGETWGPIHAASYGNNYYIIYQSGSQQAQELALAISQNNGRTWSSTVVSGDIPIATGSDKGPAIGVAPDGTLDLLFYGLDESARDCAVDLETAETGDRCVYDVYYAYSRDGGQSFSEPLLLNELFIRATLFMQIGGLSQAGPYLSIASSDVYAYPTWINTEESEGTQMYTRQIER